MKRSASQRFRPTASLPPICEYEDDDADPQQRSCSLDSSSLQDTPSNVAMRPFPLDLTPTPVKTSPTRKIAILNEDESSGVCQASGEIKETSFKLPLGPAPRPRSLMRVNLMANDSNSPSRKTSPKGFSTMPPTALSFSPITDDSPLKCSPLTSLDDDDENAKDVFEDNKENYVPSNLSSLLNAPILYKPEMSLDDDNENAKDPYDDGFVDVFEDNKQNCVPSNLSSLFNAPILYKPEMSLDDDDKNAKDPYDDGFVDVFEDNKENHVPSNLSSLSNGPVLYKPEMSRLRIEPPAVQRLSEEPTPKTTRRGLSRSPSMPNNLIMRSRPFTYKKRSEREDDSPQITPLFKRRRSVIDSQNEVPIVEKPSPRTLQRCKSEIAIKTALSRANNCKENLIGDYSKEYCLPLCPSKHQDLKGISPSTLKDLINGEFDHVVEKYLIVDCRYPYEYDGGHINGAVNLYTKGEIFKTFLESSEWRQNPKSDKRVIIIFHCEFSSKRGPRMSRFVRNHDRDINKDSYPSLFYPELYLLEGGYKAFYEQVPHLCHNGRYKTMLDKAHKDDLKFYHAKSDHGLKKRK